MKALPFYVHEQMDIKQRGSYTEAQLYRDTVIYRHNYTETTINNIDGPPPLNQIPGRRELQKKGFHAMKFV